MNELRLILKICEGCGVLWLRSEQRNEVYCQGCKVRLAEFPAPHAGKCRNHRPPRVSGRRRRPCSPARKSSNEAANQAAGTIGGAL